MLNGNIIKEIQRILFLVLDKINIEKTIEINDVKKGSPNNKYPKPHITGVFLLGKKIS